MRKEKAELLVEAFPTRKQYTSVTALSQQLQQAALSGCEEGLDAPVKRFLSDCLRKAHADEGTLWIAEPKGDRLRPIFNNGNQPEDFLRKVRQPLDRGVISMVYQSGQSFCENEVFKNASHDDSVDETLDQVTAAMIAVPVYLAGQACGVLSCVRLGEGEFEASHLIEIQFAATLLERLLDWALLQQVMEQALG